MNTKDLYQAILKTTAGVTAMNGEVGMVGSDRYVGIRRDEHGWYAAIWDSAQRRILGLAVDQLTARIKLCRENGLDAGEFEKARRALEELNNREFDRGTK